MEQLIIPYPTVFILNCTQRGIQLVIGIILFFTFIGLAKTHKVFTKDFYKNRFSLFLISCLVFIIGNSVNQNLIFLKKGRFVFDLLRLIAFLISEYDSLMYNITRSIGIFWFSASVVPLCLLVDTWVHHCLAFIEKYGRAIRILNAIILAFVIVSQIISTFVTCFLLCFPFGTKEREAGELMLRFVTYPFYIIAMILITMLCSISGFFIIRTIRKMSSEWSTGMDKKKRNAIKKIFSAIIVIISFCIIRIICSVAIGINALQILGEWISIVTYAPEFLSLFIIGLIFYPWYKLKKFFAGNQSSTNVENTERNSIPENEKDLQLDSN